MVAATLVGASEPDLPPRVGRFVMGAGWGCAQFGRRWQCWQVGRPGEQVHAWYVPWMDGLHLEATADRVCDDSGGERRCWDPPRPGDGGPHPHPPDAPRAAAPAGAPDEGHPFIKQGDLFTCAGGPHEIACWGASRDGFFGGDPCPENLRRAWPGLRGPVAAPDARCSPTPRPVQTATGFLPTLILYFEAGPRGVCSTYMGGLRCSGAIPTPQLTGLRNIAVSPGDDASACVNDLAGIACWGEAYSPPGSSAQPVLIAFEPAPTWGVGIAADSRDPDSWDSSCAIHRRCGVGSAPWPYCKPCEPALTWSDVAAAPAQFMGQRIRVRGPLGLDGTRVTTLLLCESDDPKQRPCCNQVSTRVVVGAGDGALQVGPYGCGGDESRMCCSVPALGESVVVTGRLGRGSGTGKLGMFEVEACVDP